MSLKHRNHFGYAFMMAYITILVNKYFAIKLENQNFDNEVNAMELFRAVYKYHLKA